MQKVRYIVRNTSKEYLRMKNANITCINKMKNIKNGADTTGTDKQYQSNQWWNENRTTNRDEQAKSRKCRYKGQQAQY